jgi:hypothetical protein
MKDTMTMNGGTLQSSYVQNCVCFMVALFTLLDPKIASRSVSLEIPAGI